MKIEADLNELMELVSNATDAFTTAFFLADNQRQLLKLWHFYSLGNNVIADAIIPFGVGPIGRVAESQEPFDLSKFSDRDSGLLRLYSRNEDIKSFFAVPVMNADTLAGVLCIDSKNAYVFVPKDQKLLTLFAKQISNLVNNIKVQKFVDTEASDVAFLHGFCSRIVSADNVESILQLTLDAILQLVECNSCFLSLRTDSGSDGLGRYRIEVAHRYRHMKGVIFSEQDGLAGCIIRNKESFLLANRRSDLGSYVFTSSESVGRVTSFLGVPLLARDDVLGVICLIDSKEDAFNQRDLRALSIMADTASLAITGVKAQRRSYELSTTIDGLTGLYNFSGFQERLAIAFQEASQKRRPLSLIIMDLDNLKKINDISGYRIGNEILRRFAQILLSLGRDGTIIAARYGSDEFVLIVPGATKERALLIAERIREAVSNPTFIASNYRIHVSINVGVSSFPQGSKSRGELVNHAFRVLSATKSPSDDKNDAVDKSSPSVITDHRSPITDH